jgi:hypothetical protein
MFCPKCGTQNPDEGKFCRSCGTGLGGVSQALAAPAGQQLFDRKGKPIHLEGAMKKLFMGVAFLVITIALGLSNTGEGWWFWMLIPAFGMIATGLAQYMQIKQAKNGQPVFTGAADPSLPAASPSTLPPPQTQWTAPESRYRTGDLVPPSVTDKTTRHLEIDSEGQTRTLPKE